jgi:uncharacterized membrane protein YesL
MRLEAVPESGGRAAAARASLRRAAECALLGIVWTGFSLPVVTAGGAWSAVAEVCAAWHRDEEPPLLATFAAVVRRDWAGGLALLAAAAGAGALPAIEIRVALAAGLPGARLEAVALAIVGAVAVSVLLLAFPERVATGARWLPALRGAVALATARPWAVAATAAGLAIAGFLVVVYPPLALLIAGPAGYAVSAVHTRARAGDEHP